MRMLEARHIAVARSWIKLRPPSMAHYTVRTEAERLPGMRRVTSLILLAERDQQRLGLSNVSARFLSRKVRVNEIDGMFSHYTLPP